MTITAQMIEDSISPQGKRISTMQLRYPRFIHAEFMTHRAFSRNASSSRAIPVKRLIEDVLEDTAMPIHWGKNQPGMQAREEHAAVVHYNEHNNGLIPAQGSPVDAWLEARDRAVAMAKQYSRAGYHKQIVNRLLEPFSHINVVVTATEWDNFFNLRLHPDAQPEIHELAKAMKAVMGASEPVLREYHLPYVTHLEHEVLDANTKFAISAARCARTSYMTHERKMPIVEDDVELARKLLSSKHMSPFEHQANPCEKNARAHNLKGWYSQRFILEGGM